MSGTDLAYAPTSNRPNKSLIPEVLLSPYARAVRSPVLTYRMILPGTPAVRSRRGAGACLPTRLLRDVRQLSPYACRSRHTRTMHKSVSWYCHPRIVIQARWY
eukprot:210063-Rhodomonas_salina.2